MRESLARYGKQLGIAFQIIDDVLDVRGNEAAMGKSLGTDLVKQKPTLPLIRLLSQVTRPKRRELVELLTRPGNHLADALQPWFQDSDAIDYAQDKAHHHVRLAQAELIDLPATPARDALEQLADFVVARQH